MNRLLHGTSLTEGAGRAQPAEPRRMLYHSECPEGRVFVGDAAYRVAASKGWRDTPLAQPPRAPDVPVKDMLAALAKRLEAIEAQLMHKPRPSRRLKKDT